MSELVENQSPWPSRCQRVLLDAAVQGDHRAIDAWRRWMNSSDAASPGPGSLSLFPAIYLNLSRQSYAGPGIDELRTAYEHTWILNQFRYRGLVSLLRDFAAESIDAMPLKGLPLAMFYYRDLGARRMGDIDLLVRASDFTKIRHTLTKSGWRPVRESPPAGFLPFLQADQWRHPQWGPLDVHWNPYATDCDPQATEEIWRRAQRRDHEGAWFLIPDTTDLLIHMCFHSRKGDPQSVCRWVLDVLALIADRHKQVRWDELIERARRVGMVAPVRDAISYLHREFDCQVPADVRRQLVEAPTSPEDRQRYRQISRTHGAGSLRNMIVTHWWRYRAGCAETRRKRSLLAFAKYLFSYGRHRYRCRSLATIVKGLVTSLTRRKRNAPAKTATQGTATETLQPRRAA